MAPPDADAFLGGGVTFAAGGFRGSGEGTATAAAEEGGGSRCGDAERSLDRRCAADSGVIVVLSRGGAIWIGRSATTAECALKKKNERGKHRRQESGGKGT